MVKTSLQSVSFWGERGGGDRETGRRRKTGREGEGEKRGRGGKEKEGERGGRRGKRDGEVRIIKSCCIYLAFNSSNSYQSMSNSRDF